MTVTPTALRVQADTATDTVEWTVTACKLMRVAAEEIEQMHAERLKLDRRIRNQRLALRENWQIVEDRRNWLGSSTSRRMYVSLCKRYRELLHRVYPARAAGQQAPQKDGSDG